MLKSRLRSAVLSELWENALFNDQALTLLEQYAPTRKFSPAFEREARQVLATIRNRNLISHDQQQLLQQQVVGIFGLSVGSHAAVTWIMESRARVIKIADPDTISPTNLNRLRTGWENVGRTKTAVVQAELHRLHPELKIISESQPTLVAMEKLVTQKPPLTAVVDAIDSFEGKIWLRKLCQQHRLPLVSAADVGDNVILDIERYDQQPQPEFFLGRLGRIEQIDFGALSSAQRRALIIKLVGLEANSVSMLDSLSSIGSTLGTWPQLGATATLAGGLVATTLKKIFLNESIKSGRFILSLDSLLVADHDSISYQQQVAQQTTVVKRKFGI